MPGKSQRLQTYPLSTFPSSASPHPVLTPYTRFLLARTKRGSQAEAWGKSVAYVPTRLFKISEDTSNRLASYCCCCCWCVCVFACACMHIHAHTSKFYIERRNQEVGPVVNFLLGLVTALHTVLSTFVNAFSSLTVCSKSTLPKYIQTDVYACFMGQWERMFQVWGSSIFTF